MRIEAIENKLYKSLAMEYLKFFDNENPTNIQIKMMESVLSHTWLRRAVLFDQRLTEREKACLYLSSQGNNSKQIANILGIKTGTVRIHRQEIIRKLGCKNMVQAVAVGIKYGEVFIKESENL